MNFTLFEIGSFKLEFYGVLYVILTVLAIRVLLTLIKKGLFRYARREKVDTGRYYSIYQIVKYFVWTIGIVYILDSLGVKVTLLLASGAALLVGIGFGLQTIFNDFISGLIILFEGTIEVEDIIEVNGVVGKVKRISIRSTKVLTRDDVTILIPNHKFIAENVINWSYGNETTRFHIDVGVCYGTDTKLVSNILKECAANHNLISKKPIPFIRFNKFGESALEFQLFFWSNSIFEIENIKSDLHFMIDKKFREKGIVIPFPQRDLHIISDVRMPSSQNGSPLDIN